MGESLSVWRIKTLRNIFRIVEFLRDKNFPYEVPNFIKNKYGRYRCRLNKKNIIIYKKIPGKSVKILNNKQFNEMAEVLANAEFLKDGRVRQNRAIVLKTFMKESKTNDKKKYIDKTLNFLLELWTYGIHEKTFKLHSNLGVLNDRIVLLDLFELTGNKNKVGKQLRNIRWYKLPKLQTYLTPKLIEYFVEEADKKLNLDNLNKYWKIKR